MGDLASTVPFIRPSPPRLSGLAAELRLIELSRIYTNHGPVNMRFEHALECEMFGAAGGCVTVCNATTGLMLAMRAVMERRRDRVPSRSAPCRYALMPSFTFAAAAQAADWIGLTPLFCDVDPQDWSACAASEERLIARHGGEIAVIVPYATFGSCIDLDRYARLSERTGIPVVVDAAASLGSLDADGRAFGAGFAHPVVFSMHATKTFATAEGGVIHCGDRALVETLRVMGNFGFGAPRSATMPGLNAKLSEVGALLALERLHGFREVVRHRERLAARYRDLLPDHVFQRVRGLRCAHQFMPMLPPAEFEHRRDELVAALAADGVGTGTYFSPHVAEQPFFRQRGLADDLAVTERLSRSMLALPLWDEMTVETVDAVCGRLRVAHARLDRGRAGRLAAIRTVSVTGPGLIERTPGRVSVRTLGRARPRPAPVADGAASVRIGTLVVGGGPAGLAPLIAASARGLLPEILSHGVVVVERSGSIGDGRLGCYATNSDSSAQTFLSCLAGRHDPRIGALAEHPVALAIAGHGGGTVPLALVGALLRLVGAAFADIVAGSPAGQVLTGHEAVSTCRLAGGGWSTRLRRLADGRITEIVSDTVLLATGGLQSDAGLDRVRIGGRPLHAAHRERLRHSDRAVTTDGIAEIAERLRTISAPRVAVIGGASSALACVRLLLEPGRLPPESVVTLMHRSRLTLFYPSAEAALADGYTAFGRDDICPVSGFVYRFGGLRFDSRTLARRMLGLDQAGPDPRLRMHRLGAANGAVSHETAEAWGRDRLLLDEADVIVSCIGYRPRGLPVRDVDGTALRLAMDEPGGLLAGPGCAVLDAAGEPIGGLFALGLAAGYRPGEAMGGEPSFRGQINGLWLWQNDTGLLIAERILDTLRMRTALELAAAVGSVGGAGEWRPEPVLIGSAAD